MLQSARALRMSDTSSRPVSDNSEPARYKQFKISVNAGSILILLQSISGGSPIFVQSFQFLFFEIASDTSRWEMKDGKNRILTGRNHKPVEAEDGLIRFSLEEPTRLWKTRYGLRTNLDIGIPIGYQLHHLAYVRRTFPQAVKDTQFLALPY